MAVRMRKVMAIPRKLNRGNRGVNHGVDTFASVLILVLYLPIIQGSFPKYTQAFLSTEILVDLSFFVFSFYSRGMICNM